MTSAKTVEHSEEIYPNIYKIVLPLSGMKPGPVNCFLFLGEKITLLDTGLSTTVQWLREALQEHDISFSRIDQVVLTHCHPDHVGGAHEISEETSADFKVAASRKDAEAIQNGMLMNMNKYFEFTQVMGVPESLGHSLFQARNEHRFMERTVNIDIFLEDGDELRLGDYRGRVIETPGHTVGSICIHLEEQDILFSGDHILPHITPNALVIPEEDSVLPRRSSQQEFYDSISKIERINPGRTYPGHGEMIPDVRRMGDVYRECFMERQSRIIDILESGHQVVYPIARELFAEVNEDMLGFEVPLMLSEVYSHLQILESQNRVALQVEEGVLKARLLEHRTG